MSSSSPNARDIEAMTFVYTASTPATPRARSPWTRLLRWGQERLRQRRPRESIAMNTVRESTARGTR